MSELIDVPFNLNFESCRHKALPNQEDVSPLKALLAYQALVHPDHPLRHEGSNGLELHLGTVISVITDKSSLPD